MGCKVQEIREEHHKMNDHFLLIGLEDHQRIRELLEELVPLSTIRICQNTKKARDILEHHEVDFFFLDAGLGYEVCMDFFQWLLEHRPTYGAIIGDRLEPILYVNAINSVIVLNALVRPVSLTQWTETLHRYYDLCQKHHGEDLKRLKSKKMHWYSRDCAPEYAAAQDPSGTETRGETL